MWIVIVVLIAIAAYAAYSAKTPEGWDWKKGLAAVVALGAAAWAWASGLFSGAPPV
jgi:tryptophan-rich sensory protein